MSTEEPVSIIENVAAPKPRGNRLRGVFGHGKGAGGYAEIMALLMILLTVSSIGFSLLTIHSVNECDHKDDESIAIAHRIKTSSIIIPTVLCTTLILYALYRGVEKHEKAVLGFFSVVSVAVFMQAFYTQSNNDVLNKSTSGWGEFREVLSYVMMVLAGATGGMAVSFLVGHHRPESGIGFAYGKNLAEFSTSKHIPSFHFMRR